MSNFLTVLLVAVSLSMDTFSLSMAYGMIGLDEKNIFKLSIAVGIFHLFMPLLGNFLGEYILTIIKFDVSLIIGIVFLTLSIQIMFSLFKDEEVTPIDGLTSIMIFALSVSLDSFSVGIGLNAISNNHIASSSIFMVISFIFTYLGLKSGEKLTNLIGNKAQIIGMIILLILSINYIIKGC